MVARVNLGCSHIHSFASANPTMTSRQQLEQFCAIVLQDVSLQDALSRLDDTETFVARVIAEGNRCGLRFGEEDVQAVMRQNRHAFLMRRVAG